MLITYNGDTALPVQIGTYKVVATIMENNYIGSAEGILQIIAVPDDDIPEYVLQNTDVTLYPNPAHNSTRLHIQNYCGEIQMKLVNTLGQTLIKDSYYVQQQFITDINLEQLPKGAYILILYCNKQMISKTIIKQ